MSDYLIIKDKFKNSECVIYEGKVYTKYKKKLIKYKDNIYYKNAPSVKIGSSSMHNMKIVKTMINNDKNIELDKSMVQKIN